MDRRAVVLAGVDREALEASPDIVFALTPELRLAYVNPSWEAFARANDGADVLERWGVGSDYLSSISEPRLRRAVERRFLAARPGNPVSWEFSCNSPERLRRFHCHVQRLEGSGQLLVINSLREESPAPPGEVLSAAELARRFQSPTGVFVQCAECRRTATPDRARWVWVPQLLRRGVADVSHGLCPVCLAAYEVG